jgi:hypothetical protein
MFERALQTLLSCDTEQQMRLTFRLFDTDDNGFITGEAASVAVQRTSR